jgi:hypothetical protein
MLKTERMPASAGTPTKEKAPTVGRNRNTRNRRDVNNRRTSATAKFPKQQDD